MTDLRPMTSWASDGRGIIRFIPGSISSFCNGETQGTEKYLPALMKRTKKQKENAIRKARAKHMRKIGHTYIKIAHVLGVSITTASNDCM